MIKTILVDDEEKSRETLSKIIKRYCPQVNIIAEASDAEEAFKLITQLEPELVFLDIEMPHQTGFDLLARFEKVNFHVVFTTAYDQYAIKAIKFSALDYLLKPIDIEELIDAVKKVEQLKNNEEPLDDQYKHLLDNVKDRTVKPAKIGIPTQEGLTFVNINQLIRCEAEGSYTKLYLKPNQEVLATGTVKEFEELLNEHHFIRVHHSHLINANCIYKYLKGEGGILVMDDGGEVPISRRKKEAFLKQLQTLK